MMQSRRRILAWLGGGAVALAASKSRAASLSDWLVAVDIARRFAAAGIPARSFTVSSGSMMPTLHEGDVVLADLRGAGKLPARGDVAVFRHDDGTYWLKRVLGLPGDRIAFRDYVPVLNGKKLAVKELGTATLATDFDTETFSLREETVPGQKPYRVALQPAGINFGLRLAAIPETLVPPGQIYAVGDNRDNSNDSRIPGFEPVTLTDIVGRVVYRLRPDPAWLVPQSSVPGLT